MIDKEPTWLTLQQAVAWIDARGLDHDVAVSKFLDGLRKGKIKSRGRKDNGNKTKEPIAEWVWDLESLKNSIGNMITIPGSDERFDSAITIYGVEISYDGIKKWFDPVDLNSNNKIKIRTQNRDEPKYRSDYIKLMLAAEVYFGERIKKGARNWAKKPEVVEWVTTNYGDFISKKEVSDTLIGYIATLIRGSEQTKGGRPKLKTKNNKKIK